jgi:peptide methionine sulfoxide reductase msrA/msrB
MFVAKFVLVFVGLALLALAAGAVWGQAGKGASQTQPAAPKALPKALSPVGTMPPLTAEEKAIIVNKGTERPFTGKYWNSAAKGVYLCRQCGAPLYLSDSKFKSDCGWPSFDDEIPGAVRRQRDADGSRTEILCANCGAHLGHVFLGEGLTLRDTRHCVNSASLSFLPEEKWPLQRAIFAGGCFWGVEHYFRQAPGVLGVRSGYTGGKVERPTYEQVCTGSTGHAESVEVLFDPAKVTYEALARLFFEIHDPTTKNSQGPDVGLQYRSAVFYLSDEQKKTDEKLIALLQKRGYKVVTEVAPATTFWPAEDYHQDYLDKHPGRADCHVKTDRFGPATQPARTATPVRSASPTTKPT